MANSWSIDITQLPNGTLVFQPDLPDAKPGQPLGVNKGDNITWYNKTNGALTLQVVSVSPPPPPPGLDYLTDEIPAGTVSDPIFNVTQTAGTTIVYSCVSPSQPQHSIVVS